MSKEYIIDASSNESITLPQLRGEVTLQLVNVETGEVEHEQTESNIITMVGYANLINTDTGAFASISPRLWISERRHGKNPALVQGGSGYGLIQTWEVASLTPSSFQNGVTKTISSPYMSEFRAQYNPIASNRTIWSVGIAASGDTAGGLCPKTMVSLTTPCVQNGTSPGPGQVLFLTYRIQILPSTDDPNGYPAVRTMDRWYMERTSGNFNFVDGAMSIPAYIYNYNQAAPNWNRNVNRNMGVMTVPVSHSIYRYSSSDNYAASNGVITYPSPFSATTSRSLRYGGARFSGTYGNNTAIGAIFGSFYYGRDVDAGNSTGSGNFWQGSLFSAPAVRSNWQPVQNIFGHGVNGTEPFQQVTQLATGTGVVNATGSAWTNPDFPEYYRLEINATGDVTTARYTFQHRRMSGFSQNSTGTNSSWTSGPMSSAILPTQSGGHGAFNQLDQSATLTGSFHYRRVHPTNWGEFSRQIEKYDGSSVVGWDATGVTLFKIKTEEYVCWDTNSIPSMPVTSVRQCCVDDVGNIWVACTATGVWKINVAGNTVTNYTTFNAINTTNAYAIQCGAGNEVFALVNGGLVSTGDGGTNWTTRSFTYTGISDSNWDKVYWMRIQKNSPTYRMVLGRSTDSGSTGQFVWWSTAATPAIAGYTTGGSFYNGYGTYQENSFRNSRNIVASATGDFWLFGTNNGTYRITYGTAGIVTLQGSLSYYQNKGWDFDYDYYGTPYTVQHNSNYGDSGGRILIDRDAINIGRFSPMNANYNDASRTGINFGNGMSLCPQYVSGNSVTCYHLWSPSPNVSAMGGVTTRMNLGLKDSPFEEFVWNRYKWNGSAWVKGYHAPALDTAGAGGGPFNGTRHLFDCESHTFMGRSCIVAPTAATSTYFTNQLSFAAQINPLASLPGQGSITAGAGPQQLFSWIDLVTGNSVQVYNNNGAGSFVVKGNGTPVTIGTSPTNGVTANVSVVINSTGPNTTAAVYINGVQLGTTQTIITGGTLNFAQANCELVVGGNRVNVVDGIGFYKATEFYRGTMANVLFDSVAWTGTEVAAHQANPLTYTTGTTRIRYQLNDSLATLESKPLHTGYENLLYGVQNKFTNGVSGTSFVNQESYTFGVCNGILKDNATSFTHSASVYILPVEHDFNDKDLASVPATTTLVTEAVVPRNYPSNSYPNETYCPPGYFPAGYTPGSETMWSFQETTGNVTLVGTISNGPITGETGTTFVDFGLDDGTFPGGGAKWGIRVKADNTIDIRYNNSIVSASVTTWVVGDNVSIVRTAGVFTFFKNAVLLYTTSGGQNSTANVRVAYRRSNQQYYQMDVSNITITYDRPAYIVGIGNPGTFTGKYDPTFHSFDGWSTRNFVVTIAGYADPATVSLHDYTQTLGNFVGTPPAVNNVKIATDAGYMLFNSADAGKAITVSCTMIKRNI